MGGIKYHRHDTPVVQHHGIFFRQLSLWQGTALILSGTIGAGILGIPFAIAQVGVPIGLVYIIAIGLLMMGLNLFVGELAARTKQELQLVGFAKMYLGRVGEILMTIITYGMLTGVLVVYIIGEGQTLSVLVGGDPFWWSCFFVLLVALLVYKGLRTIKTIELIMSLSVLTVVLTLAAFSGPHVELNHLLYYDTAYLFLPYGVLLFAYHGVTAIPEAHSLLANKDVTFKRAIILSGSIAIAVYTLFALVVIGVTGNETTEIATIGLGQAVGSSLLVLGNIFAVLAMGTTGLMVSLSVRDSLRWDFKIPYGPATIMVITIPFIIFLLGLREFIAVINLVGGVFMSLQLLLIVLIYWRAKQGGHWQKSLSPGRWVTWFGVLLSLVFILGIVYSISKLFT